MARYLQRSQAQLVLGSLSLLGTTTDSAGNVFTIKAQGNGLSWGAGEPIDVAVQRWMTDGAVVFTQGYDNREIAFQVKITAASATALAFGEAALVEACTSANSLAWTPPEGSAFTATTVFDVWTAHITQAFDVDDENRFTRAYQVTMTAKPWARSANLTTVTSVPTAGAGTVTSVDACTSATGWAGNYNGASVYAATAIRVSANPSWTGSPRTITLQHTRTGSVTGMGTLPYLAIDMRVGGSPIQSMTITVDGLACSKVGSVGTTQYWKVPASVTSFTTLQVRTNLLMSSPGQFLTADIYDVSKTDTVGTVSTHKMLQRSMDVGGAVKTSGSIQVASPSATVLGATLLYTCPDTGNGYSPPLRQYRQSGGALTADATAVSGQREALAPITYSIPAGALREGTYVVVIRWIFTGAVVTPSSPGAAVINAYDAAGGIVVTQLTGPRPPDQAAAGVLWQVVGAITLPGFSSPAESQLPTKLQFTTSGGTPGNQTLDEVFLLDVTHGAFTMVTSAPRTFTRLWVDSPDADMTRNRPQVYYGTAADRSDAGRLNSSQILAIGDHDLDPNGAMVLAVTDGVNDATVGATFYHRWHSNAAD